MNDAELGRLVRAIVERDGSLTIDRNAPIGLPTTFTIGADCGSDREAETDENLEAALARYAR